MSDGQQTRDWLVGRCNQPKLPVDDAALRGASTGNVDQRGLTSAIGEPRSALAGLEVLIGGEPR